LSKTICSAIARKKRVMTIATKNSIRQPLSALGKLTVAALLGSALAFLVQIFLTGEFNIPLITITMLLLIGAGLVATGIRWTPLVGSLLSLNITFGSLFFQSYTIYHLTHPAEVNFFTVTLLFTLLGLVVIGAGFGATVQNYRIPDLHERYSPRWVSFALTGLTGIFVGAVLVVLLTQGSAGANVNIPNSAGEPTVHMGPGNFVQSSVTVSKGSKLLLVDDGSFVHILRNGRWNADGTPQPITEPGSPIVNNVQVDRNSLEIGPFTTAGTYHLYCTVHQGMNLTIRVQ
jgi:plastocyanin/putative flippase GtrA